ncbi:MAG TPA: hypothetical protein VGJ97_06315 [Anaerolineaceae bacterium]|jgi:hypothetical protein
MWIEYVRDGLKKGQQVFRRSVIESLLQEIEQQKTSAGDSADVAALKRDLAVLKKQYRDLNIRYHQAKSPVAGQGLMNELESEGDASMPLRNNIEIPD